VEDPVFEKRTLIVLSFIFALASRPADAALQLMVSDGTSSMTFVDGGAGDTSPETGILSVSYSIGSWILNSTIAASNSGEEDSSTALLELTSIHLSSWAPGTLTLTATDTGYTLPTTDLISLAGLIGGFTTGSVSYESYLDTTNTAFGTEHLIGEVDAYSGAFSGSTSSSIAYTSPNPFSLTTQVNVTHGGGGQVSVFQAIGTAVVPEPGVVGLLGLGLGVVGLVSLRQRRRLLRR
jgi:hypothetical protein